MWDRHGGGLRGLLRQLRFARQCLPRCLLRGSTERELRLGSERRHAPGAGVLGGEGVIDRYGVVEATRLLLARTEHERSPDVGGRERLRGRDHHPGRVAAARRRELAREAEAIARGGGRDGSRAWRPRARADHDHAQQA